MIIVEIINCFHYPNIANLCVVSEKEKKQALYKNIYFTCNEFSIADECNITGEIRLQNGKASNEGRVEVCYNGLWGSVGIIGSGWGLKEASVVCSQLGYSSICESSVGWSLSKIFSISLEFAPCFAFPTV